MTELMPYWMWTLVLLLLVLVFCAAAPLRDPAEWLSGDDAQKPPKPPAARKRRWHA